MKKKSIFVVDDSLNYINELTLELDNIDEIMTLGYALNGNIALDKIGMFNELDVLLISTTIKSIDAYQLLNELRAHKNYYPKIKQIIVQTPIVNEYVSTKVKEAGGDLVITRPCSIETLIGYIKDNTVPKQINQFETMTKKVTRMLHTVGIPAHVKGYHYLREAIEMCIKEPNLIGQITKNLYPDIAQKFDSSPTKVERAIRHAIEIGWNRGSEDSINEIFGNTISSTKAKPTNSEFIAMMADYISITEGYENKKISL